MRIHSPYPASWALAQRIGYLYSEGEIIYLADTPFERLLDIQRQVGQCQTMTSLSQADFEARLEAVFHQNTGESCHERCNSDPHPTPEIRSRG